MSVFAKEIDELARLVNSPKATASDIRNAADAIQVKAGALAYGGRLNLRLQDVSAALQSGRSSIFGYNHLTSEKRAKLLDAVEAIAAEAKKTSPVMAGEPEGRVAALQAVGAQHASAKATLAALPPAPPAAPPKLPKAMRDRITDAVFAAAGGKPLPVAASPAPTVTKLDPAVALFRFRQLAASDRPAYFAAHRNELEQGVKLATGLDRSIASHQLAATARETGAPAAVETLSPAQALFRFRGLHGAERAAYFNTHRDEIKAGAQLTDGADRSKAYFEIKIAEKKGPTK